MRKFYYVAVCFCVAACGDPIADIPRLSDQDIPDDTASVEVVAAPTVEGSTLMERLLGGAPTQPEPAARTLAANPDGPPVTEDSSLLATSPEPEPETKKTGLLSMLTRAAPPKQDIAPATPETEAVKVALSAEDEIQPDADDSKATMPTTPMPELAVEETKRKGIFGIKSAKRQTAKPTSEIEPGTVLPYGKVARICDLPKRAMGTKVAQYPEKRSKHIIYDSAPGTAAPHSFFITGFDDGCARQFTASLAMFGSVALHEQLRYGLPSEVQPYSATDKAYEQLKSKVCSVSRKKPCGAKISRLDGDTVFVSIYERFGSNPQWTTLLLHDGDVLAQDKKGG